MFFVILWIFNIAAIMFFIIQPLCGWIYETFFERSKYREVRIDRNARRWRRRIQFTKLTDLAARREIRKQRKKAKNDVLDEAAHTMAVCQEMMEEMDNRKTLTSRHATRRARKKKRRRRYGY